MSFIVIFSPDLRSDSASQHLVLMSLVSFTLKEFLSHTSTFNLDTFEYCRQLFYRMCNIFLQLDSGYEFGGQEYYASDKIFLSVYHS